METNRFNKLSFIFSAVHGARVGALLGSPRAQGLRWGGTAGLNPLPASAGETLGGCGARWWQNSFN